MLNLNRAEIKSVRGAAKVDPEYEKMFKDFNDEHRERRRV